MAINDQLKYIQFFVREQKFSISNEIADGDRKADINLVLGFADPKIIEESTQDRVAVFPFIIKMIEDSHFELESKFVVGFKINDENITSAESLKSIINDNNDDFTKIINEITNKILDNALQYANIKFDDPIAIEAIAYN